MLEFLTSKQIRERRKIDRQKNAGINIKIEIYVNRKFINKKFINRKYIDRIFQTEIQIDRNIDR